MSRSRGWFRPRCDGGTMATRYGPACTSGPGQGGGRWPQPTCARSAVPRQWSPSRSRRRVVVVLQRVVQQGIASAGRRRQGHQRFGRVQHATGPVVEGGEVGDGQVAAWYVLLEQHPGRVLGEQVGGALSGVGGGGYDR